MTDKNYYKIMSWLCWFMIGLGAISVILWLSGINADFKLSDLDSSILSCSMLAMIKIMKAKDEIIGIQAKIIEREE
jgi:hypothetical protein